MKTCKHTIKKFKGQIKTILQAIKHRGGLIRMAEAIDMGISRYTLYSLLNKGKLEQISRGIFRLAELPPISEPDLVAVSVRSPRSVICLLSALSFHNITTAIPHKIAIAVSRGSQTPKIDSLPLDVHRFSKAAFESGIEEHNIDGATVRIYNKEKTLADCFKFRNKIGMDIVLESLKLYKEHAHLKIDDLFKYAQICRVDKIMEPYVDALM
jgi:predicted transcriptional regulator of viral defense system